MIGLHCSPNQQPASLKRQADELDCQDAESFQHSTSGLNSDNLASYIKQQDKRQTDDSQCKFPVQVSSSSGERRRLAGSPGYHSAASSPNSSAASPVSSSSLNSSGACLSSSSQKCSSPQASRSPISFNLLDYYPELNQDGIGLTWSHDANSRSKLDAALQSSKMIISGDISLAEMSRYPVPIMARQPLGASDLTLENWLQDSIRARPQRGLKLTFTSTRTVEPAFRVLARHADQIKGPLILSADILTWPQRPNQPAKGGGSGQQPVDAWTFLMMCRTRFPRSIISIGWCQPAAAPQSHWPSSQLEAPLDSSPGNLMSSAGDQLFELDLVGAHPALGQLVNVAHLQQQLAARTNPNHRLHQQLLATPFPLLHQQLQHHGHLSLLSSSGSLSSSSSGNSSGSPSPTSPTNLCVGPKSVAADSTDQMFLTAAGKCMGSPAAAAMTAALVAASNSLQHQQQLPLNLNISETSRSQQQHKTLAGQLAQRIQSYQTLSQHGSGQLQADQTQTQQQPMRSSVELHLGHVSKRAALSADQNQSQRRASHLLLQTAQSPAERGYTREMIDKMASLVKEYNLTQPLTFPVEAKLVAGSVCELQRLLYQVGAHATLTVRVQQDDLIGVDELLAVRKSFAAHQLLFDLPDDLAAAMKRLDV